MIDAALRKREAEGRPIRVASIGAGFMYAPRRAPRKSLKSASPPSPETLSPIACATTGRNALYAMMVSAPAEAIMALRRPTNGTLLPMKPSASAPAICTAVRAQPD